MPFDGLRVVAFESRRAAEMAELIRRNGGEPFVAPSMREAPVESNDEALRFAERLFRGEFDLMVLLTGVGTRALAKVIDGRFGAGRFADALRQITVAARGSKPVAVLREMDIRPTLVAPEPNTWREMLDIIRPRPERRIAVQEYGRTNVDLLDGLRAIGAEVTTVRVYQWALPDDTGPLREAAHRIARDEFDVVLFTTSVQIAHLLTIAAEEGIEGDLQSGLARTVIASVGPTTTEGLAEHGLTPDFEPTHPKMGFLVKETADAAGTLLAKKRGARA
ncbi:MAG TPA: uroporphyrinogen-III synthase [Bryobacteraceae bacterium]|nr:uroporphyrinogen-III synthase [Bryobacteraceae bacterium]